MTGESGSGDLKSTQPSWDKSHPGIPCKYLQFSVIKICSNLENCTRKNVGRKTQGKPSTHFFSPFSCGWLGHNRRATGLPTLLILWVAWHFFFKLPDSWDCGIVRISNLIYKRGWHATVAASKKCWRSSLRPQKLVANTKIKWIKNRLHLRSQAHRVQPWRSGSAGSIQGTFL